MAFTPNAEQIPGKWRALLLLSLAELLVMAVWFSASAVVPALTAAWQLDEAGRAWLTMSVQIGFVVGAFGSAVLTLPDRIPAHRLMAVSALLAAWMTLLIPLLANDLPLALVLRFLTGVFLAGVYPVGMKLMTTWTKADRGLGIGLLVGALTVGSASPHLLNALGGVGDVDLAVPEALQEIVGRRRGLASGAGAGGGIRICWRGAGSGVCAAWPVRDKITALQHP